MAILVDQPRWKAHGTLWAHLVSDASLEELHAFAGRTGLPERAFDLDHYDVPAERYAELVAAGAVPVSAREMVLRLRASGLRVRAVDRRDERARRRLDDLRHRWRSRVGDGESATKVLEELLERWSEPHRSYHDLSHLAAVLHHLDTLSGAGEAVSRAVVLAAWFHDAVHTGRAGADERASAELARARCTELGLTAEAPEVARLVLLTIGHDPGPEDCTGAALCDADLAILAAPPARYRAYTAAVRQEYRHVDDHDFVRGRAAVLSALMGQEHLFGTTYARATWEAPARANLRAELDQLVP